MFLHALGYGLVDAAVIVIAAVGITIQFAVTNFVNFSYGAVMTIGIYVMGSIWARGGAWIAVLAVLAGTGAAAALSLGIGTLLNRWFVRRHAPKLVILIATFGVFLIVENATLAIWGPNYRSLPIATQVQHNFGPVALTTNDLVVILLGLASVLATHLLLRHTTLGERMRAVSDNEGLAAVTGINVRAVINLAWLISGAFAGLAGLAFALDVSTYSSSSADTFLFLFFAAVVVGGVGNVYGAMIGGLILGIVTDLSTLILDPAYKYMVGLALLVVVVLFRPSGVFGGAKVRILDS